MGVPLPIMKSYTAGAPFLDPHCMKRLGMIEADIVHVHSPFVAGRAALAYVKKHRVPMVGTFHSKYYDDFLQITGVELLAEVGTKYVVDFYNRCDEVWAVSSSSADTLRSYGYQGDVRVMTNGTDVRPLPPGAAEAAEARFGLGDRPVLLFVGQMNWKKNLRRILEAAALVKEDYLLVFAGQGPHEKEIRRLSEELGLGDRCVFTGHLTDRDVLNGLFARASLFLFPSLYDNAPMVLREAAAMGTPAVTVRGSSAAEAIRDGENGFLCEDDSEDLARVIRGALSDPANLEKIGRRAAETIPIPWDLLLDRVLERYGALCEAYGKAGETGI
jgi:glycosyltransferase involved in cell wall biosynthesis